MNLPDFTRLMKLGHGIALVQAGAAQVRRRQTMGINAAFMIYKHEPTSPTKVHLFMSVCDDRDAEGEAALRIATGKPIYASNATMTAVR